MKRIILSVVVGLFTLTTYAQVTEQNNIVKDTIYFNGSCVGYIKNVKVNNGLQDNFNGVSIPQSLSVDVMMTTALNNKELEMLELPIDPKYRNLPIDLNYDYDFKLPSDYLKQSANYRDDAIKTRLTTSLIGAGLCIIGGIVASKPSYSTTTTNTQVLTGYNANGYPMYTNIPTTTITPNNDNRNMGLVISGIGLSTITLGMCISINLDLKSNEMLRKGAVKFKLNNL
jgi:hypothetical protein